MNENLEQEKKIAAKSRKRRHPGKTVTALLAVLALASVNILPLSAMSEERIPMCGMEEHVHGEECYTEDENGERIQNCSLDEHVHSEHCFLQENSENGNGEEPGEPSVEEPPVISTPTPTPFEEGTLSKDEMQSEDKIQEEDKGQQEGEPAPDEPGAEEKPGEETETDNKEQPPQVSEGSLDLNSHPEKITGASLEYREKESSAWNQSEGAMIPGNADLRLNVRYENIFKKDLIEKHGKQLVYTLPDVFRKIRISGNGDIVAGNGQGVGMIQVSGNTVVLTFTNDTWLSEQGDELKGAFTVEGEIDLKKLEQGQINGSINIGNLSIAVNFDSQDVLAKYASVDLAKEIAENKIISDETGDYLKYTLKVSAGQDGCPKVIVEDKILDGKEKYVEAVVFPKDTQNVSAKGTGTFVWTVGNMEPNTEKTLTYQVKLRTKNEKGGNLYWNKNIGSLRNEAEVFALGAGGEKFSHGIQIKEFTPQANFISIQKKRIGNLKREENGGYRITYGAQFQANTSNNYIVKNMELIDSLKEPGYNTDLKALPYVAYDQESIRVYRGVKDVHEENPLESGYQITWDDDRKSFHMNLGDIKPGDAYYVQYDLVVGPEAFLEVGNPALEVNNRIILKSDNTQSEGKAYIDAYTKREIIAYDNWIKKEADKDATAQEEKIPMPGDFIYDTSSGKVVQKEPSPGEFMVPAGSYRYQVTLNEKGHWNLSETLLSDHLKSSRIEFTGYVCVRAYNPETGELKEERWVKPGKNSYSFKMKEIGFVNAKDKYVLTYYAKPVNLSGISQMIIGNEFSISELIGVGSTQNYRLEGMKTEAAITVSGNNSFETGKEAWYYEKPGMSWKKGAIYWLLTVNGDFGKNIVLKDVTETDKNTLPKDEQQYFRKSYFREDSLAGIYTGKNVDFSGYKNLEALMDGNVLQEFATDKYTAEYGASAGDNKYGELSIKMTEDIHLGEDTMYIVVRTEPDTLPEGIRGAAVYKNNLFSKDENEGLIGTKSAVYHLASGGGNILKELQTLVYVDKSGNAEFENNRGDTRIVKDQFTIPGAYAVWTVKVNYEGKLSGSYRVVDTVPDGMEAVYARLKWKGTDAQAVKMGQSSSLIKEGWEEHSITASKDSGGTETSYYYTRGNQIAWELGGFVQKDVVDTDSVDCQVVCRVTDKDVLLGAETKSFNNEAALKNQEGTEIIDRNNHRVSFRGTGKITKDHAEHGSEIEYVIRINEKGYDLTAEEKVTLIDRMSENQKLISQVKVVNSETGNEISQVSIVQEDQILKIQLPDNQPLTITYTVRIDAPPDTEIDLRNQAYWEGYGSSSGDEVEILHYRYSFSGTAGSETHPSISIYKNDRNNINTMLSGAEFIMKEGNLENGRFVPGTDRKNREKTWSGVTDESGVLTLGKDSLLMEYNTIYELVETKAPQGYIREDVPYYFVVLDKINGTYPEFPDEINGCRLIRFYKGGEYKLVISNRSGVSLPETGGKGTEPYTIMGGVLLLGSGLLLLAERKRRIL